MIFAISAGQTSKRKTCASCWLKIRNKGKPLADRTKGELFGSRKNWQSARTTIRKHAFDMFVASGAAKICRVCGYAAHVEIAHIVSVSSFPDAATLTLINATDNLIALCPNHHWEFDNGVLSVEDVR